MQAAASTTEREPKRVARRSPAKAISPAPILVPEPITARYPEAIFGKLPADFVLQGQPIWALNAWHRKAMKAVNDLPKGHTDDELTEAMAVANEIFEAIKQKNESGAKAVSVQMSAIVERFAFMGNDDSIEEELSVDDFMRIAAALEKAVAPIKPTKAMGALIRGGKLTKAGMLFRYQSFLIQELMTLSNSLYGHPRYALNYVFSDDEVTKRCSPSSRKSRSKHPFFDEIELPTRARAVLKSLKIDCERPDPAYGSGK